MKGKILEFYTDQRLNPLISLENECINYCLLSDKTNIKIFWVNIFDVKLAYP